MKKLCLLAFSFLIFLLSFKISFAESDSAFAQTATSSLQQDVNYELSYPGLLPDSPLYFLRVIRDRISSFLISDPLVKAKFDLLQADKRINAGIYLVNKGKIPLALTTISKAENYFEEAIGAMGEAKKEGKDISDIEGKMRNALRKYEQELKILGFDQELKRVTSFEQRLNQ